MDLIEPGHSTRGTSAEEQLLENAQRRTTELAKELEKLAKTVDAAELFAVLVPLMALGQREGMREAEYGTVPVQIEHLAFYLWPYAYVQVDRPFPTSEQVTRCLEIMPELVLHQCAAAAESGVDEPNVEARILLHQLRMHSRIVRGSAYPEQTAEEINNIPGAFDDWFHKTTGIAPTKATTCLIAIVHEEERRATEVMGECRARAKEASTTWTTAKRKPTRKLTETERLMFQNYATEKSAATAYAVHGLEQSLCATVPVPYDDLHQVFPDLQESEWIGLHKLIGLDATSRAPMTDPYEVKARPLYVLPDGRVLLADISSAMDALWESYEKVARTNQPFFDSQYVPRRARWVEEKVTECMARIFTADTVHTNVRYHDPARPNGEAETDILIAWGPFLVVIEIKATAVSPDTLDGDPAAVRRDVKKNIVNPMTQADRVLRHIASNATPLFKDGKTGQQINVASAIPPKTFAITVSQHHLSGLSTDLKQLESLYSSRKTRIYPFSICLADLDVITTFCGSPEVFLHFLQRRLALQANEFLLNGDEQDIFLAYLEHRLSPDRFTLTDNKGDPSGVTFMGWGEEIRQYFQWRRKERKEKPDIRLRIPEEINTVLTQLRRRKDDAARWIAFALLDLPDRNLNDIAEFVHHISTTTLPPGTFRTFMSDSEDTAVYVTGACPVNANELEERTNLRIALEKHRRRKPKAVGLSFVTNGNGIALHTAAWLEGEWAIDPRMDKLSDEIRCAPITPAKSTGRNSPCLCGSGKKYKHCCLKKQIT